MKRAVVTERGAVAVMVALLLAPVLLGAAALGVEVSRWFALLERVQRAADAAALAAAPLWSVDRSRARSAAVDAMARNSITPVTAMRLDVNSGSLPGRVRVTVHVTVDNPLGALVGTPRRELTRSAEAAWSASVSLGGTCNLFGEEPSPASGDGTDPADGTGSVMSTLCPMGRRPGFWATVAGPDSAKENGDRYASRWCTAGSTGCRAPINTDYSGSSGSSGTVSSSGVTDGQPWYLLRITVRRPVSSFAVQLFDPALVDVGDRCDRLPVSSAVDPSWPGATRANAYVTDAARRYEFGNQSTSPPSSGASCTGDTVPLNASGAPTSPLPVTTFSVHSPTASGEPWGTSAMSGCVKQYGGWSMPTAALVRALTSTLPADRPLQRLFRQWVTLCTVTAPSVGDYILQVRTNIRPGGATPTRMGDPREDSASAGVGANRFAVRVSVPDGQDAVTVSAVERMAIFANLSAGTSSFLLARVGTAAAGAALTVDLFDIGDTMSTATVTVLPPPRATGTSGVVCLAEGDVRGSPAAPVALPGCSLSQVSATSGFNGIAQRVGVQIPSDYSCRDDDPTDCWFRMAIAYGVDARDTTTWSAWLEGDPLRLTE